MKKCCNSKLPLSLIFPFMPGLEEWRNSCSCPPWMVWTSSFAGSDRWRSSLMGTNVEQGGEPIVLCDRLNQVNCYVTSQKWQAIICSDEGHPNHLCVFSLTDFSLQCIPLGNQIPSIDHIWSISSPDNDEPTFLLAADSVPQLLYQITFQPHTTEAWQIHWKTVSVEIESMASVHILHIASLDPTWNQSLVVIWAPSSSANDRVNRNCSMGRMSNTTLQIATPHLGVENSELIVSPNRRKFVVSSWKYIPSWTANNTPFLVDLSSRDSMDTTWPLWITESGNRLSGTHNEDVWELIGWIDNQRFLCSERTGFDMTLYLFEEGTLHPKGSIILKEALLSSATIFSLSQRQYLVGVRSTFTQPDATVVWEVICHPSFQLVEEKVWMLQEEDAYIDTEVIRWNSYDGLEIEAAIMIGQGNNPSKAPALISLHGGPDAHFKPFFALSRRQLGPYRELCEQGWVCLLLNPRGSGGYGKRFRDYVMEGHWTAALPDVLSATAFLVEQRGVDPTRISLFGYSYGGFLATHCLCTRTLQLSSEMISFRYASVVLGAPVMDLTHFSSHTEFPSFVQEHGFVQCSGEVLDREDPLRRVRQLYEKSKDDFRARVLILHGDVDTLVPLHHAKVGCDVLSELKFSCRLIVLPGCNHPPFFGPPTLFQFAREQIFQFVINESN